MPKWLNDAVFYQIYPQSFYDTNGDGIGDINGIIEKLDYIKNLGCNALWINPCFDSPFMDAGYDVADYFKVAPRYGTNDDLVNLFDKAHEKGIRVLLDLVPGHTSDKCEWFLNSKKPEENEYSNRYIWTDSVWEAPPQYKLVCGMTNRDGNYLVNFFSSQPALNYGFYEITHPKWQRSYKDPECIKTREALKSVMRFWLDKGCDGFRVDMADSLVKNDDEKIATGEIWKDVRKMLDESYPEAAIVSEWSCPKRSLKSGFHMDFYLDHQGNGYNAMFRKNDENGNNISYFSKKGVGDIKLMADELTKNIAETKKDGYISFFTCNHDGIRLSGIYDERELKIAYCTLFALPGVPFLYYGDEIAMKYQTGLVSKEGGFHRTGSRTPMQWDNSENCGFSTASEEKLYLPVDKTSNDNTVESQENREDSLYNTVRKIISLRHSIDDLKADGEFKVLYAEKNKYPFIFERNNYIVVVNPKETEETVKIDLKFSETIFKIGDFSFDDGILTVKPQSFALIKK